MVQNVYDGKPATWIPTASAEQGSQPKKAGGCWISTAAYGPDSPEVRFLETFRDERLKAHALGRAFVRRYYATGPKVAKLMTSFPVLTAVVRRIILARYCSCSAFGAHPSDSDLAH
jgi:hypothetical protein